MNSVGDIEKDGGLSLSREDEDFRAIFQSVLHEMWYTRVCACARNLAKGTRTKIDSIIVAEADERAIARSINSGTDDGRP